MKKQKYRYTAVLFAVIFQLLFFTGCASFETEQKNDIAAKNELEKSTLSDSRNDPVKTEDIMKIKISSANAEVIFEPNDSSAAKSFYEQLPITVSVENYGENEKIFEPPQKPDVSNVWEKSCPTGSIAYFSPWNNIALYYGDAPKYKGLYPMGKAVSGIERIKDLSGTITITAYIASS